MKKWILTGCWLLGIVLSVMGQGIRFEQGTFTQALEKAKKEKKILFVDAYAVWCGPCKLMSKTVFKDAEVGKYANQHFVSVKVDVERGEGPSVKIRYAIDGLPGYIFLDPEGNVAFRESGSMSAEKFMAVLKKAKECADSPDNIGRLKARYPSEKTNEAFLRTYLDKMRASGATGYYEELEQYLSVQKSMLPSSREMVDFLHEHATSLVYGGEADRIFKENYGSETWDLYVRKKIREDFQRLPEKMAKQTTEYAIIKKDTTLIDLTLERLKEAGLKVPEEQRQRLLTYYYLQTGQGEKYKASVIVEIEEFYSSLNPQALREAHLRMVKEMEKTPGRGYRTHAMTRSSSLRYQAANYARFASTPEDKLLVLKWAQRVYDILPDASDNVAFYAKVLYLYGDKAEGVKLMEKAVELGKADKNAEGLADDYELMKAGKAVML